MWIRSATGLVRSMTLADLALMLIVVCPVILVFVGIWFGWFD